jgi:hypothetical protein
MKICNKPPIIYKIEKVTTFNFTYEIAGSLGHQQEGLGPPKYDESMVRLLPTNNRA